MTDSKIETISIRDFLYLDTEKLVSISSQIFEGFVQTISSFEGDLNEKNESQKGPIGSGETLRAIVRSSIGKSETKSLSDYAFSLIEQKLRSEKLLGEPSNENPPRFVEITGRAIIQDIPHARKLFEDFNQFGKNLATIQIIDYETGEIKIPDAESTDRNQKARNKATVNGDRIIVEFAKSMGLQIDARAIRSMSELLKFAFEESLEIMIERGDRLYTAALDRRFLRQDLNLMVRKYGRRTERELVIVGQITRSGGICATSPNVGGENLRGALLNLQEAVVGIDNSLYNLLDNEAIIDPLAVYVQ